MPILIAAAGAFLARLRRRSGSARAPARGGRCSSCWRRAAAPPGASRSCWRPRPGSGARPALGRHCCGRWPRRSSWCRAWAVPARRARAWPRLARWPLARPLHRPRPARPPLARASRPRWAGRRARRRAGDRAAARGAGAPARRRRGVPGVRPARAAGRPAARHAARSAHAGPARSALQPTMPRLRESTATGGRDWRGLSRSGGRCRSTRAGCRRTAAEPLRVRLTVRTATTRCCWAATASRAQERVYEGPSFGDWPHFVALKLEYDGDYRIPVRLPLGSAGTRSFAGHAGRGARRAPSTASASSPSAPTKGRPAGRAGPCPTAPEVALGWAACSGNRGQAELRVARTARASTFRSGAGTTSRWRPRRIALPSRRSRPAEKAYGGYADGPRGRPGAPVPLRAALPHRHERATRCSSWWTAGATLRSFGGLVAPAGPPAGRGRRRARVIDATRNNYPEDTGRWTVAAVY